jgi:hypothetical protein
VDAIEEALLRNSSSGLVADAPAEAIITVNYAAAIRELQVNPGLDIPGEGAEKADPAVKNTIGRFDHALSQRLTAAEILDIKYKAV